MKNKNGYTTATYDDLLREITERKRVEEALEAAIAKAENEKDKSEAILEAMGENVIIQDTDYKIIYQNQVNRDSFGNRIGEHCYRVYEGRDAICEGCPLELSFRDGKVHRAIRSVSTERGTQNIEYTTSPLRDSTGIIIAGIKIVRDITERSRNEKALHESEERYRSLFETMVQGVVYQDSEGKIISANPAAEKILGLTFEQMQGRTSTDPRWKAIHDDGSDFPGEMHPSMVALKTGKEVRDVVMGVFNPVDGWYRWITINAVPQFRPGDDKPYQVYTTFEDISRLKRAEMQVRESEKKYRMLVDNIHDGVFIIQDAKMQFVNDAFARMSGYTIEEVIGKSFHELVAPEDLEMVTDRYHRRQAGEEVPEEDEFNMLHKDGKTRILVNMKLKIITYRGRVASMGTVMDITAKKRAENELRDEERFLENLFASIQDGIGIIDKDMNIIRVNPTAEKWYPHAFQFAGKKCFEAFHGRSERCEICPASRTLETGESAYDVVPKHGPGGKEAGWLEIYSFPMIDTTTGEMKGVIEYVRDITERRLVEKEKDRLLKAVDNSTEGITIADEKDRYIYVNAAYAKIFGYTQEELIGKTWKEITPPELIAPIEKEMSRTMYNKDISRFSGEFPGLRKDGTTTPTEVQGTALWDEKGSYQGHICIVRDITERKWAEEALQKSNRQQNAILNNIPDIAWLKDKESRFIAVNEPFAEACGVIPDDLVGKKDLDVWPRELAERYRADDIEVMMTGRRKQVEEPLVDKNGRKTWIETIKTPIYNDSGEIIGTTGIARDITERKRMEEKLRLFSEAVENAPDGVQVADLNGHIIYSNKAVEEIYGFSPEELKGKHVDEMNDDTEFASKVILPGIRESGRWIGELMVKHKGGKTFPVWLNASLVKNGKGEPIAMMGIIRDVTERKNAEEAIEKYARDLEESNRIKELFSDILHHDLLNPLSTANGFVELLKDNETRAEKISYLETIERNLAKSMELIGSATNFSKIESLESIELGDMDLRDVVDEVIENFEHTATKAESRLESRIKQNMPVRANKIIEEVFANLISNALKYAPGRIVVDGEDGGEIFRLRFTDFGKGIRDTYKTAIFERFRRMEKTGVKGSGLGLAIARKIVELHKGRIWVEDNPEGGAVFVLEIPKHLK